jgi:hypothetical protein
MSHDVIKGGSSTCRLCFSKLDKALPLIIESIGTLFYDEFGNCAIFGRCQNTESFQKLISIQKTPGELLLKLFASSVHGNDTVYE